MTAGNKASTRASLFPTETESPTTLLVSPGVTDSPSYPESDSVPKTLLSPDGRRIDWSVRLGLTQTPIIERTELFIPLFSKDPTRVLVRSVPSSGTSRSTDPYTGRVCVGFGRDYPGEVT